jgi:hypothetical protein
VRGESEVRRGKDGKVTGRKGGGIITIGIVEDGGVGHGELVEEVFVDGPGWGFNHHQPQVEHPYVNKTRTISSLEQLNPLRIDPLPVRQDLTDPVPTAVGHNDVGCKFA